MKRVIMLAAIGLALLCLIGILLAVLSVFAGPGTRGEPEPELPALTLDETLLSLLDGDNAAVDASRGGDCYAELTLQGAARITYFSPYLSAKFALAREGEAVWAAGEQEGFCAQNPFAEGLRVHALELCDIIDPETPAIDGQPSLRQLFCCEQPITYELLCAALQQTPELREIDLALYDGEFVAGGAAPGTDGRRDRRVGQNITGGQERAEFRAQGVRLTVDFIRTEEGLLAFHVILKKE